VTTHMLVADFRRHYDPGMTLKRLRHVTRPIRRRIAQLIYSRTEKECQAYRELASAALSGQPYFGDALFAFRGDPMRQRHFASVVAKVAATATGPVRVLEIGSWAGSSAIAWANALRESGTGGSIVCVDPWRPYASAPAVMDDAMHDDTVYHLFRHNVRASGIEGMVEVMRGDSRAVLGALATGSFDIVYIDGDHSYAAVHSDIAQAMRITRPGGVVCGDDLERQRHEVSDALYADAVASGEDDIHGFHPGVTRAVAEHFGPVPAWDGFWAVGK
jgi:predicted O-methyltransferase YrrM